MALNTKQFAEKVTDNIKVLLDNFHHSETGESVNEIFIEDLIKGIISGGIDLTEEGVESTKTDCRYYKYINDKRRFIRVLITNYTNLDLDIKLEGLLSRFSKNIRQDGSGIVDIDNCYSINSLSKNIGMKPQTLSKMLKNLSNQRALRLERDKNNTYIYLNPEVVRYGNIITEKLKIMFNVENELIKLIEM